MLSTDGFDHEKQQEVWEVEEKEYVAKAAENKKGGHRWVILCFGVVLLFWVVPAILAVFSGNKVGLLVGGVVFFLAYALASALIIAPPSGLVAIFLG